MERGLEEVQALWQELTRTKEKENECQSSVNLPGELWRIIASHFKHADLFAFALTCRSFREKQKEMEIEFVTKRSAVEDAAKLGNVKTLAWLRREGARWVDRTCSAAASVGGVETLAFLRSQDPPCPWNEEYTCWFAASNGHLDALRWLRTQDPPCPWDSKIFTAAAGRGNLKVLEYLVEAGCPWDLNGATVTAASSEGHLETVKWLVSQGAPWSEYGETCTAAAGGGHTGVLAFLIEAGCPWDIYGGTCATAASRGHLDTLRWLRSLSPPCPLDVQSPWTCQSVASAGHLDVLKFLREEEGCAWDDEHACFSAAQNGHLDVLKYLCAEGVPLDVLKACKREASQPHNNHEHIVSWILSCGGSESYTDSDTDWED